MSGVGYFKPSRRNAYVSPASKQMAVYQNPFSLATNNPKIPDGKCSLSAGQRYQAVESFTNDNSEAMYFILFPGLNAGLYTVGAAQDRVLSYNNDTQLRINSNGTRVDVGPVTDGQAIAQWRVVSQGMKLSLVNNADENDGWFEAVRLTISQEPDNWRIDYPLNPAIQAAGKHGANGLVIRPKSDSNGAIIQGINRVNFVENATYRTGKLRDIHKHAFILKADSNDHDFIQLHPSVISGTGDGPLIDDDFGALQPNNNACQRLSDMLFDKSMDMIVVVVHGRVSGSSTAPQNPSNILAHLVANHEMCYEPSTQLARFHSESYDITRSIPSAPYVRRLKKRRMMKRMR